MDADNAKNKDDSSLPEGYLPADIITLICMRIDDAQTLRNIRLTGHQWLDAANRALFSHLDVSLDLRSLMGLDNVAYSSYAPAVNSLFFRSPRKVSSLIYNSDLDDYDDDGSHQNYHLSRYTGYANDDPDQINAVLARSLRRLGSVKEVELRLDIPSTHTFGRDYEDPLRGAALSALSHATPPKLRSLILQFSGTMHAKQFYTRRRAVIDDLFGKVQDVRIDFNTVWERLAPGSEDVSWWIAVANRGSQLHQLEFRSSGSPWRIKSGITYHFRELRSLVLSNFELKASHICQILTPSIGTLQKLTLARIRLDDGTWRGEEAGTFDEIFRCLATSQCLEELELQHLIYGKEWNIYCRHMNRYGESDDNDSDDSDGDNRGSQCWLKTRPKLWDMFCSQEEQDLCASRDLLRIVDKNRARCGLQPAFEEAEDWSEATSQATWLLKLPSLDECIKSSDGRETWEKDWGAGMESCVWSKYPLRTRQLRRPQVE